MAKKRGSKTTTRRGETALPKSCGTGFEEYYADPPMTPKEALDEKQAVYSDDLSFEERIQSCIKRFRARRRLRGDNSRYFQEYLFLGGIDPQPQAFSGGGDDQADEETIMIPNGSGFGDPMDRHYDGDREHWSVDFTAVVSGFLTVAGPITGFEGLAQTADVVDNFLRYVLHHDVCPEYSQDIRKAIDVCEAARDEWPLLASFSSVLPGTFNLALAHAFGVYEANDWPFAEAMDAKAKDEAQMIWLTILALSGQKDLCDLAFTNRHLCRVSREVQCDLEVTAINRLSRDEKEEAKTARIGDTVLAPVGRVDLEPTTIQDGWVYPVRAQHPPGWKTSVFFEEPILDHLRVGNKMSVTLCEVQLDGSSKTPAFAFVKTVHDILPTFYTFLPQQLMRHFKAPKEMDWQAPDADEDQQAPDAKEDE